MPVFEPVDTATFFERERDVMRFWQEKRIFERSLTKPSAKGEYVFYEGPPTANGIPHAGHVLTRVVKDLFPRYKTMCGYHVARKAGWDTHGLPVEIEVEKELGISGKDQIESFGVEPFVRKCMDSVFRYTREWEEMTNRVGFWLDMPTAYVTYHTSYVESVWWSLTQLFSRGLLVRGHKVVPWCPRCGTALSSHEVGQGYEEIDDPSAFVLFRSRDDASTYFLAWTTTPWTLLSNAALAVKDDVDYAYVRSGERTIVMAAALVASVMGKEPHELLRTVPGRELVGKSYEPLYDFARFTEKAHYVVAADFVGLDAGSGIVHVAPAFGADDYKVGRENGLPVIQLVDAKGEFTPEVTPWAGKFCKATDREIARELRERGLLFKLETYRHDYPHCWRCHGPLIYFARDSWFVRTTQEVGKLIGNSNAIAWQPDHIRTGRFGKFLESNVDWALSRERYWGTPLPIWRCDPCDRYEAFGSKAEIVVREPGAFEAFESRRAADPSLSEHLAVHKPFIDSIKLPCATCAAPMTRASEVIDCWYDAGSMPFAQWGYPHAEGSVAAFRGAFPADFISEAIDQTRGWFYTLLAVSTLVFPEQPIPHPFRRCIVLGHVSDPKGKKYSKHLKNYVPPMEIIERQGADAFRWFFYVTGNPWTNIRFSEGMVSEAKGDFLVRLLHVYSFFVIYASIDGWDPRRPEHRMVEGELEELDRWILSELHATVASTRAALDAYDIHAAARALFDMVEGLSTWYVRRIRERCWKSSRPEEDSGKRAAYATLHECLATLSRAMAPFVPFMAESIYQNLVRGVDAAAAESVHLADYPEAQPARVDESLRRKMALAREVVALGRGARVDAKMKVRQPLREAVVVLTDHARERELVDLVAVVADELNVKKLSFKPAAEEYVKVALKLNFPRLGPRLGPKVKRLQALLAAADAAVLKARLDADGKIEMDVDGTAVELTPEDLKIEIASREGFVARSSRDVVVALDTQLDDDLRIECRARELSSVVNRWRSEMKLPYEARIKVRLALPEVLKVALERHEAAFREDVLATEVEVVDVASTRPEGARDGEAEGQAFWGLVVACS